MCVVGSKVFPTKENQLLILQKNIVYVHSGPTLYCEPAVVNDIGWLQDRVEKYVY